MSKVALAVTLTLEPGMRDRFLERVARHKETCLELEPGCVQFDILVPEEENEVLLYEVYADEEAVETHLSTTHMQAYLEETGPWIAERRRRRCRLLND